MSGEQEAKGVESHVDLWEEPETGQKVALRTDLVLVACIKCLSHRLSDGEDGENSQQHREEGTRIRCPSGIEGRRENLILVVLLTDRSTY